jgi:ABC-type transport system involved in cytochrome c biogenesis permease subunit
VWCLGASFFAYGVLAVSFAIVISHLGARVLKACRLFVWENQALVVHPVLQTDGYTLALFAFPILTSAILAGFIWAARSGGQFWSWDYLRTASPLVWVLFGLYLHATHLPRWRGAVAVLFSALGFLGIVLVFVGPRLSVMLGL